MIIMLFESQYATSY